MNHLYKIFTITLIATLNPLSANSDTLPPLTCYVEGTVLDVREAEKTHRNNPDEFSKVTKTIYVADIKITKIAEAKNCTAENYCYTEAESCVIKDYEYDKKLRSTGGYGEITTLELGEVDMPFYILDKSEKLKKEMLNKKITGNTYNGGDEYGWYFGFENYKLTRTPDKIK